MRILAVTNLYPNPLQPNRATFNAQQFRAVSAFCPLAVISPISWTDKWSAHRNGAPPMHHGKYSADGSIAVDHPVYFFPPRILRGYYGTFFRWSITGSFREAVCKFQPDVVLGSWVYPDGWAAMNLARRFKLPVVVKAHGSDLLTLLVPGTRRHRLASQVMREADGIIAVSQDLARRAVELGAKAPRVRVIYNGVDTSVFRPGSSSDARSRLKISPELPMILFVGNLVPVKGLETLIEAGAILSREGLNFRMYLIGQGPLRALLEKQAMSLSIADRVEFIGTKAHRELADWFGAANVFVLPSRSEGVPNVLLEASACGTPYVASRVGGIPEIAHLGRGTLVPAGDARAFVQAIRQYLQPRAADQPTLIQRFRSHEDAAAELVEFLHEIVQRSNAEKR